MWEPAQDDKLNWRWVVFGLHSALQIAMIMVLKNDLDHFDERSKKRIHQYQEDRGEPRTIEYPEYLRTAEFLVLLDKLAMKRPDATLKDFLKQSATKLHQHRNELMHFGEYGLSIHVQDLRQMLKDCFLLLKDWILPHPANVFYGVGSDEKYQKVMNRMSAYLSGTDR